MTAACQLCGQIISADAVVNVLLTPGEDAMAALNVAEFDLLAGRMAQHLSAVHPRESAQAAKVMFLAGKVYAMTWAESGTEPNFKRLRSAWRKTIFHDLTEAYRDEPADALALPLDTGAAGKEGSEEPSGSNEKKSSRNFSS